ATNPRQGRHLPKTMRVRERGRPERNRLQRKHRSITPAGPPTRRVLSWVKSDQKTEREHGNEAQTREQPRHFGQVQWHECVVYPHGPPLTGLPLRITHLC